MTPSSQIRPPPGRDGLERAKGVAQQGHRHLGTGADRTGPAAREDRGLNAGRTTTPPSRSRWPSWWPGCRFRYAGRRQTPAPSWRSAACALDMAASQVWYEGTPIKLTAHEFRVLGYRCSTGQGGVPQRAHRTTSMPRISTGILILLRCLSAGSARRPTPISSRRCAARLPDQRMSRVQGSRGGLNEAGGTLRGRLWSIAMVWCGLFLFATGFSLQTMMRNYGRRRRPTACLQPYDPLARLRSSRTACRSSPNPL